MSTRLALTLFIVGCILCGAVWIRYLDRTSASTKQVYMRELAEAMYTGTVAVGIESFHFNSGYLATRSPSDRAESLAYDIAYAAIISERRPVLALPGDDLDALRKQLSRLEATIGEVARVQGTFRDAIAIRQALYPIEFMYTLTDVEQTRRDFIAQPTQTRRVAYERALQRALRLGEASISRFTGTFERYAGDDDATYLTLGGKITTDSIRSAASRIAERNMITRALEPGCMLCGTAVPSSAPGVDRTATADYRTVQEVLAILRDAYGTELPGSDTVVMLPMSTCIATPGTQFFVLSSGASGPVRFKYVSDLYFISTDREGAKTLAHIQDAYGIDHVRFEPLSFYSCPDVSTDLALVRGTAEAARFARLHPTIATNSRPKLTARFISYNDAVDYVNEALKEPLHDTVTRMQLADIALMLHGFSGLEHIVTEITNVLDTDLLLSAKGVPFDLSAKHLIISHSAISSLFQSTYGTAAHEPVYLLQSRGGEMYAGIRTFTELRYSLSNDEIRRFVRETARYEGTLADGAPETD